MIHLKLPFFFKILSFKIRNQEPPMKFQTLKQYAIDLQSISKTKYKYEISTIIVTGLLAAHNLDQILQDVYY